MHSRENVPLQLALIVFVSLTVMLSVSTYLYFRRSEEELRKSQVLAARVTELESVQRAADQERARLKTVIGHAVTADLKAVEETHARDALDVEPAQHERKPYRGLLSVLADALRNSISRESAAGAREVAALEKIGRQRGEFADRLAQEERRAAGFQRQLAEAENVFARERMRLTALWDQLAQQLEDKLKLLAEWDVKYRRLEQTLTAQLAATQRKYDTLRDRWEAGRIDDLEHADGKVVDVSGRLRMATINLGRADLLPKGQQFSVYDASAPRIKDAKRKGTIEVTRILDDHSAEARITSDSLRDPILPGDQIHTAGWQPGQKRRFALAAPLDWDGDGKSDYQLVRGLILASGGQIDAEVDEEGHRTGQLSVETRYVIVGVAQDKPSQAHGDEVTRLLAEAKQLGVDPLSPAKFFNLVGHVPSARVVKYGGSR